jgi:1,4-dihydroxy-2-naphthoyl-CoA hydrolase
MESFQCQRTIYLADTDSAGVVYFARFFELAHECFENYLNEHKLQLSKILLELNFLLPITSANCIYKKPLKLSEIATIILKLERASEHTIATKYEILNQNKELCAEVELKHTFVSKTDWKKAQIAEQFKKLLPTS